MKAIIILSIATSVTLGSLEPAGYKPPAGVAGQSDRYLPASLSSSQLPSHRRISNQGLTPESHYLPTSYQSPSQNVIPNSLYLPTSNIRSLSLSGIGSSGSSSSSSGTSVVGEIPSVQYLPSQPSISRRNPFSSGNSRQYSSQNSGSITTTATTTAAGGITSALDHRISNSLGVANTRILPLSPLPETTTSQQRTLPPVSSSQYLPPSPSLVSPSKHSDTFIPSVPSSNYLASTVSKQNQYHGRIDQPSSTSVVTASIPVPLSSFSSSSSSSSSSSPSTSTTSSGIISNTYLTPNKLSGSLSGFSSLSQSNQYTGGTAAIAGQPPQPTGGNINQPPGNFYPSAETFGGYTDHKPLAKYEFEYHVNDQFGNDYSHKETQNDNKITQGVYTVLLPDGRKQIVHYTADQNGFKPTITYEEAPGSGYQY